MNILIYFSIFIFKLIEEALRTLRIIVVSNGKKILGAILQFFIALIWLIVTGTVIVDIEKDPIKILIYSIGSLFGSYIGSYIEEKIAMGTNVFMVEINTNIANQLISKLNTKKCKINILKSFKKDYELLMITSPRKKSNEIIKTIRLFDKSANIISEKAKISKPDNM